MQKKDFILWSKFFKHLERDFESVKMRGKVFPELLHSFDIFRNPHLSEALIIHFYLEIVIALHFQMDPDPNCLDPQGKM